MILVLLIVGGHHWPNTNNTCSFWNETVKSLGLGRGINLSVVNWTAGSVLFMFHTDLEDDVLITKD
jgi:hypothetical protein